MVSFRLPLSLLEVHVWLHFLNSFSTQNSSSYFGKQTSTVAESLNELSISRSRNFNPKLSISAASESVGANNNEKVIRAFFA